MGRGPRQRELVEGKLFMSQETHIVGFRVGRETYGVPITSLHEIVRVPEITAVPDAPDYLEGVINLRGKIVSVVDLRKRVGQPSAGIDRRQCADKHLCQILRSHYVSFAFLRRPFPDGHQL